MKSRNGSFLLAAGVAAGLFGASEGCESEKSNYDESHPAFIEQDHSDDYRIKQKEEIGKRIVEILQEDGELDRVEYELHSFDPNNPTTDLIIKGYEREGEVFWSEWAVNLDHICRITYTKQDEDSRLWGEMSKGEVIPIPNLKPETVTQLIEIINEYIENNGEQCENWNELYQKNYGSQLGPTK